jgi:hypothetical protein
MVRYAPNTFAVLIVPFYSMSAWLGYFVTHKSSYLIEIVLGSNLINNEIEVMLNGALLTGRHEVLPLIIRRSGRRPNLRWRRRRSEEYG